MMKHHLIHFALFFTFYIIGAYSTTDILRLLKGCSVSMNAPDCYCPVCNKKLTFRDQIPIFSYLKHHGACSYCGSHIPFSNFGLELFLFVSFSLISYSFNFNWIAYFLCVILYQMTKISFLLIFGKRTVDFLKNILLSLINNLILFSLIAILFFIGQIL